jgi:hypothetical protein
MGRKPVVENVTAHSKDCFEPAGIDRSLRLNHLSEQRSTSHTSLRSGALIRLLTSVELQEKPFRTEHKFVVGHRIKSELMDAPQNLGGGLLLLRLWQVIKGIEERFYFVSHWSTSDIGVDKHGCVSLTVSHLSSAFQSTHPQNLT